MVGFLLKINIYYLLYFILTNYCNKKENKIDLLFSFVGDIF